MIKRNVLIPSLLTLTMCAHGADLSGPVSGAVFHSGSRAIRPILGVPGSAYLGVAIASGLDAAAVSPNHKLAIAIRDGQGVVFTGVDEASPVEAEVDAIPGADKLFWSSDSTVAGLYSSKSGAVQTWRNGGLRKPGSISGNVLALAVDGAGRSKAARVPASTRYRPEVQAPRNGSGGCRDLPGIHGAVSREPPVLGLAGDAHERRAGDPDR